METLSLDLPNELENALSAAGYTKKRLEETARHYLAAALFSQKVLSLGQAARLAGMSLWDFIPFIGSQGIAVADYDDVETKKELEAVEWLLKEIEK